MVLSSLRINFSACLLTCPSLPTWIKKFSSYLQNKNLIELGLNFSICMLQAGAWSLGQSCPTDFAVPQELEKSIQNTFIVFSSMAANWHGQPLSQGELKLNYSKKPYIITMQTFHTLLLLIHCIASIVDPLTPLLPESLLQFWAFCCSSVAVVSPSGVGK